MACWNGWHPWWQLYSIIERLNGFLRASGISRRVVRGGECLCRPGFFLNSARDGTVDGSEILRSPVEVGSLSYYLQGFLHLRWCRISSINSITGIFWASIFCYHFFVMLNQCHFCQVIPTIGWHTILMGSVLEVPNFCFTKNLDFYLVPHIEIGVFYCNLLNHPFFQDFLEIAVYQIDDRCHPSSIIRREV